MLPLWIRVPSDSAPITLRGFRSSDHRETHPVLSHPLLFGSQLMMIFFLGFRKVEAQRELIPSPFSEPRRRSREAPGAVLVRLRALGGARGNPGGGASGFKASAASWGL